LGGRRDFTDAAHDCRDGTILVLERVFSGTTPHSTGWNARALTINFVQLGIPSSAQPAVEAARRQVPGNDRCERFAPAAQTAESLYGAGLKPIFHITSRTEAAEAARSGEYIPEEFDADGFIHCSYAHQVTRVADFKFHGRSDVVLLEIDRTALSCDVIDENLEGQAELFPHIYGRLPMSAVVKIHDLPCRSDGRFELPADLPA
jgi:uncharacterized protein (DUF952 family)